MALMRLRILSREVVAYDKTFHYGLNIIRGDNGGGKSTIADFIFYVLGGNAKWFKPEALECDTVFAEFEINQNPIVIRRQVEVQGRPGMFLYWGRLEESLKAGIDKWRLYPSVRTANQESYSQILFRELGIPEVKEDTGANVTFYQLLRLIYVDQLSSLQSLLRDEDAFDTAPIRSAIYDVLTGTYLDDLYSDIFSLRDAERQQAEAKAQVAGIRKFLLQSKIVADAATLEKANLRLNKSLAEVEEKITKASLTQARASKQEATNNIDSLRAQIRQLKSNYDNAVSDRDRASLELVDSNLFIDELKKRLQEIDDSIAVHTIFGELPITHCPCCLSVIKASSNNELCPLCQQSLSSSGRYSHVMQMKHDLAQQLRESSELAVDKEIFLQEAHVAVAQAKALLEAKQQELNSAVNEARTQRESIVDILFTEKGRLLAEIEHLGRQAQIVTTLQQLSKRLEELNTLVGNLSHKIDAAKKTQQSRASQAALKVEEIALKLIASDYIREPAFANAHKVEVNAAKNSFSLDGRNNFSASSIVYLKNCIHFAIFFASLELDFFRYPRFILCDNMEDKGMQVERSRNLQRKVAELSEDSGTLHQIIFTTSMIDPSLNNEKYCIGEFYIPGKTWSLNLPPKLPATATSTSPSA